jgi:hypothetical protein
MGIIAVNIVTESSTIQLRFCVELMFLNNQEYFQLFYSKIIDRSVVVTPLYNLLKFNANAHLLVKKHE